MSKNNKEYETLIVTASMWNILKASAYFEMEPSYIVDGKRKLAIKVILGTSALKYQPKVAS